jgi:hypothetical protein
LELVLSNVQTPTTTSEVQEKVRRKLRLLRGRFNTDSRIGPNQAGMRDYRKWVKGSEILDEGEMRGAIDPKSGRSLELVLEDVAPLVREEGLFIGVTVIDNGPDKPVGYRLVVT